MKIAITGTSQGLGKAIKKELQTNYTICEFRRSFKYDLTKIENIKLFAKSYAPIDVLILNAGISYFYKINELTQLEIINIINTNLICNVFLVQEILAVCNLKHIIAISSNSAIEAFPTNSVYAASKAGLSQFLKCVKKEKPEIKICNFYHFQSLICFFSEHIFIISFSLLKI